MRYLFRQYKDVRLRVYGNLQAAIASLAGIAAEELAEAKLVETHPDYPVLICVSARA
jgi:hypothetical protein